ncbi:CD109 antigen-like [Anopheles darlingi]|uniref:CD109 antigen-like n=1 Tax=Anopheles darlingi TaxID=43151 RepID=UPI00210026E9|nr:CD109 antigen-like [Anopheles darlingi]
MWLPRKQDVCVVLMLISMGQAVLIVGPKSLRANRDYTVVISNFFGEVTDAELLLRLEGRDANNQVLFAVEKPVEVLQNTNEIISFQIPLIVSPGIYKMIIEGVNSFVYHDEIELEYLHKSISGLIQLRQPVYKPGDSVQFRVIVLDPDLKPPSGLKMVTVTVQDSVGNIIRKWSDAQLYNGVFEGQLDIAPSPLLGTYNIIAKANDEELVSKTFEVKEYVLPTFKMDVLPTVTPLEEHQALNLTIVAKYYVGNPAIGRVKIQLYDGDNNLELSKEYDVNGMLQVHLPFTNELILYGEQENVRVNVTFTERNTNELEMTIELKRANAQHELRPNSTINIIVNGRPKSYVALASYDRSLLELGKDHDISNLKWEDVLKLFNEHDGAGATSLFEDIGVFIRANGLKIEEGQLDPTFRTDFLESWLWKNITLPTNGSFMVEAVIPDTITTWYLTGFSIHPVYGFEIIKTPLQLTTGKPFYIVDHLPYSIKRGEVVPLHFTLFNTLNTEYTADVTMFNVEDEIQFIDQPADAKNRTKTVSVPPNVGYPISFLVKAKKLGDITVRVKASTIRGLENDAIEKIIRVTPESLEIADVKSQFFCFSEPNSQTYEIVLPINRKSDLNSVEINFSLDPNLLTDVVDNLQNLLAVPSGSGETNMIKFVPNIMVLDYMMATGSKQHDIIKKAKEYLQTGYRNQMNYRQTDGSFADSRKSGGSVFLTAFVAKAIQTAAKYIYVDENQVPRAYDWLSSKQLSNGRYVEVGSIAHQDMQGGLRQGLALTSYVMIAFLENAEQATRHHTVVARGMKYIADNLEWMTDSYDLAIATYALCLNNHYKKPRALEKLIGRSVETGNGTQRYWPRSAHKIETTAYALLSFIEAKEYSIGIAILRWLVNQRYTTGSFPRTQETFVGLKALTKLSEIVNPAKNEYDMYLTYKDVTKQHRFDSYNIEKVEYNNLRSTTRIITMTIAGQGSGLIQVAYKYHLNLVNFERSFELAVNKTDTDSDAVLKLDVCTSFIPKLSDQRSNMALVEVNLPSGYVTATGLIVEKPGINPIRKREILYGATTAVLYYDNMGIEKNCFTITAHKRMKEAIRRPSYVTVHDYYYPEYNAIQIYE